MNESDDENIQNSGIREYSGKNKSKYVGSIEINLRSLNEDNNSPSKDSERIQFIDSTESDLLKLEEAADIQKSKSNDV